MKYSLYSQVFVHIGIDVSVVSRWCQCVCEYLSIHVYMYECVI